MELLTLRQAMAQAGVYQGDSDLVRDIKFSQWIGQRQYKLVDKDTNADVGPEVELLILKEK